MRIDVIGGSGFIGTRLCLRLEKSGRPFHILDKNRSELFPNMTSIADVRSSQQLREHVHHGSVLVNLAAEHRDDVRPISLYEEVNVNGAKNVCAVASEKNIRTIIFTSTVAVYGFAPVGTKEDGAIAPFNPYGKTKHQAEEILKEWQAGAPQERAVVIIRPTVVFGEGNRGNVYNLLRQIATGRFVMIGDGRNRKSVAYVENVAAFIEHACSFGPGLHVYNFSDKPDFTMNDLVAAVQRALGKTEKIRIRLPYFVGYSVGLVCDLLSASTGRRLPISAIRVKKFCVNSVYDSGVARTGFLPPVSLDEALERTIRHEFVEARASSALQGK